MLGTVSDAIRRSISRTRSDLGSATQTVAGRRRLDGWSMPGSSGTLSGSGGLTMTGDGTLELTASNTYTGTTTVSGGILRLSNTGALPGGTAASDGISNLVLDGGAVELDSEDFTRGLGSGPAQVQFTGHRRFQRHRAAAAW